MWFLANKLHFQGIAMENTKIETGAVEQVEMKAQQAKLQELNDLQLALVGGGIADVVFG